jgi:hypothetical protein
MMPDTSLQWTGRVPRRVPIPRRWLPILIVLAPVVASIGCGWEPWASRAYKHELATAELSDGTKIRYGLTEPESFDEDVEYPLVIAMPLGFENYKNAALTIRELWRGEAQTNDWVVVSPAEPDERLFWRDKFLYGKGGEEHFPEFLSHLLDTYRVRGSRFHIVGLGHNGVGAISIALQSPEYFKSLTLVPLFDPPVADLRKLAQNPHLRITILISEKSVHWDATRGRGAAPDIPGVVVKRIPISDPGARNGVGPFVEAIPFVCEEISSTLGAP